MYRLSLIIIILLSLETLSAQDYKDFYYEVYLGNKLYHQGNYSEALAQYEAASEKVDFVSTSYLQKFLKAAKKDKNETLQKKYEFQIERQKECPVEYAHIGARLDSLVKEDQRVRTKNFKLNKYYRKHIDNKAVHNSPKFLRAKEASLDWERTDSLNVQILLSMFEEHGFLGESKIGSERSSDLFLLLLHFDKDSSNVVLKPILDKALKDSQINPGYYAIILDRHLFACNLPQKFYRWPMLRSDPKLSEEEKNEVLKSREDIGLYGTDFTILGKRGHWQVVNSWSATD